MNNFSITSLFKEAWGLTRKNINFLVVAGIVSFVLNFVLSGLHHGILNLFVSAAVIVFAVGMLHVTLRVADNGVPDIDQFKVSFGECVQVFVAFILMGISVCIGAILLVIPGIIVLTRLSMTVYILVDQKMSAVSAMKESWKVTKGFGWEIFTFIFFSVLIVIVSGIPFGLGLIISIPFVQVAHALLYRKISGVRTESDIVIEPIVSEEEPISQ